MKKIRLMRNENDISNLPDYTAKSTEQDLVLLSKSSERAINKKLYQQLKSGTLDEKDSTLIVPLYIVEKNYDIKKKERKEISKNTFNSSDVADRAVMQILSSINTDINFYENSVYILGKSLISPLSSTGNSYYDFYLTDSLVQYGGSKQHEIHFRSKNPKNLAFNGKFTFDSVSLSITSIEAELPNIANINYIKGLSIKQTFNPLTHHKWSLQSEEMSLNMSYPIFKDSLNFIPEILVKRSNEINTSDSIRIYENFAKSEYSLMTLEEKIDQLDNTPLMRAAKWFADAALTSYARAGFIDFGKLNQVMRLTDVEGFRLNLPLRTNERLWKNISIGGYAGYGFRNKEVKYSAFGQFKLPTKKRRVFEISYLDDYRRINYDYNNFTAREGVWNLGDDDIVNTLFSFYSGEKLSPRKEWLFSYSNDWNRDIESRLYVRSNKLFSNDALPLYKDSVPLNSITQQSLTVSTRFSFNQNRYEDHTQRIYIDNTKPVIYATLEAGRSKVQNNFHYYGKILGSVKQIVPFSIGEWTYLAEAGWVFGNVPYPSLEIISRDDPGGINFYKYFQTDYFEFAADKYVRFYNELVFNGIVFNYIPLIKHLNLREFIALKGAVGGINKKKHEEILDIPDMYVHDMKNPYLEGSIGITNILRIFRIQFNYRFTNHHPGLKPWSITFGLRFGF
ncbi:DUF5686 family protein [Paludibacteraceae bacterium OttesenSCG-928-F17]|nr:DUF5686 family protein [Paludibacteraceae bacterium OttesenSCG-928-F17]